MYVLLISLHTRIITSLFFPHLALRLRLVYVDVLPHWILQATSMSLDLLPLSHGSVRDQGKFSICCAPVVVTLDDIKAVLVVGEEELNVGDDLFLGADGETTVLVVDVIISPLQVSPSQLRLLLKDAILQLCVCVCVCVSVYVST